MYVNPIVCSEWLLARGKVLQSVWTVVAWCWAREKWGRWSRSGSGLKDSCGLRRPRSKLPLGGSRCIANSLLLLRMIRASQLKREDIIHLHLTDEGKEPLVILILSSFCFCLLVGGSRWLIAH